MRAPRVDSTNLVSFARDCLARAERLSPAALATRRLAVGRIALDVQFSDLDYAALCSDRVGSASPGAGLTDATVYAVVAAEIGLAALPALGGETFDRKRFNAILAEDGLRGTYMREPRVWQFFSDRTRIGVQLVRDGAGRPAWDDGAPLRNFIHWALPKGGPRLCHAASLGRDGRGVLVVGSGGSGKSGTVLVGIARGFMTAGDDYCLVEAEETVRGLLAYRLIKQDSAGVARAFGLGRSLAAGAVNWQGKHEIPASALRGGVFAPELEIHAIVVPRVARRERSAIQPIRAAEAMRSFAPSSVFQLPDDERAGSVFAADLCRRLPAFGLELSTDADDIARALGELIDRNPA
jgi:hypothetical protein